MKTLLIATVVMLSGCSSDCAKSTSQDAGTMETSKLTKKLDMSNAMTASEVVISADEKGE